MITVMQYIKPILLLTLLTGCFEIACSQTTNFKNYAVLVSGIARNFQWPDHQGHFEILVFGNSRVYNELMTLIDQKKIDGIDVKIIHTDKVIDIDSPRIIYLSDGRSSMLSDIMAKVEGKPTMIITEREGLFKRGAGMSFVINNSNQLRLDINETDLLKRNIKAPINVVMMLANDKI
jgi:hypothetical protein